MTIGSLQPIDLSAAARAGSILEAALGYSRVGVSILPIAFKDGRKYPVGIKGYQNIWNPSNDQIRQWYRNPRFVGVALRPGAGSQNLIVIDCDGLPVYEEFCKTFPQHAKTYTERSGSGQGFHLYYQVQQLPDRQRTPELTSRKVARKGILNTSDLGFEIFFDTGLITVAPSPHPTGRRYTIENDSQVQQHDNIDDIICWALALETEADKLRKPRHSTQQGRAVLAGEISSDVITAIESALGVDRFNADGWSQPIRCPFGDHEHDAHAPGAAWNRKSHILHCHKHGQTWLAKETAEQLGIPWPTRHPPVPAAEQHPWPPLLPPTKLEKPTPDTKVCARYLADAKFSFDGHTLAIRSPLGSGKTDWAIDLINREQPRRVLYVTFQQSLTENIAQRLNKNVQGEKFEHYLNIPGEFSLASIDRLVCSLNSTYRCEGAEAYDLVIFDEPEQGIPALWDGTMQGDEIPRAFRVLTDILRRARKGVVLDAHLSQPTVDFLRDIRGNATVIENTYRPAWPSLMMYQYESRLMEAAMACAEQNPTLPVVITTSSRKAARRYRLFFAARFGAEGVKLIYGWNSHHKTVRRDLKNLNQELPHLRVLITSPTVGTGVDITCEVAGVFGFFSGQHLPPTAWFQQLARYRNARCFAATIPNIEGSRFEDPEELLSRTRFKIYHTRTLAGLNHDVSAEQGQLTRLWAFYTALHNRLSNHPLATFTALAEGEGFPLQWEGGRSESVQTQLKAAQETQQREDDDLTLSLDPLSTDEMNSKRMDGKLVEQDYLANRRWRIEDTTGQIISAELLQRYGSRQRLRGLVRFTTYYLGGRAEAARVDRLDTHKLPFKRQAASLNNTFFDGLLKAAFGADGLQSAEEIPAGELKHRISPYLESHRQAIEALDNRRTDLSEEPVALFRRMLNRFGVQLTYHRIRVEGERTYAYSIDRKSLAVLMEDARKRWAALQKRLSQIAYSEANIRDLGHLPLKVPIVNGATSKSPLLPARDRISQRRAAGLPLNPFAVPAVQA